MEWEWLWNWPWHNDQIFGNVYKGQFSETLMIGGEPVSSAYWSNPRLEEGPTEGNSIKHYDTPIISYMPFTPKEDTLVEKLKELKVAVREKSNGKPYTLPSDVEVVDLDPD